MAADATATRLQAGARLSLAATRLAEAGVASAGVDARRLLAHVLGERRVPADRALSRAESAAFDRLVDRRRAREPLQLITGRCGFRLLDLVCEPGVFVPRPETEIVTGLAIARVQSPRAGASATASRRDRTRPLPAHPVVVEPCTGSGAIGVSIAAEVPGARVVAGDADPTAVALARRNADRARRGEAGVASLAAGAEIDVVHSDLLDGVDGALRGHVDLLVANPPYLPATDASTWEPEVADHDPRGALVGGPVGHELVDALLALAGDWLRPAGALVLEIDARHAADVAAVARRVGLVDVRVEPDLTGASRALVATAPGAPGHGRART